MVSSITLNLKQASRSIILKIGIMTLAFVIISSMISAQQEIKFEHEDFPAIVNGIELGSAFSGGLNNPQFSEIDLNRDGVQDLYIFDRAGYVSLTLINNGGNYIYDPSFLDIFPDLYEWVLLKDYNKDGIEDIFSSSFAQGPQGVEVHTGSLVGGRLHYELETVAGRPSTMLNIPAGGSTTHLPVDYIDIPDISDIDGDGDLDILSFGPSSGYMHWYRNMASENNWSLDSLRFRQEDFCWGKFFESGISSEITLSQSPDECASFRSGRLETRHAGSTVLSWDLDNNGQKDLLIGDVGNDNILALYNTGTARKAYITDQELNFPDYDVPVDMPIFLGTFAIDYDLDGDDDLLVAPNNEFTSENKNAVWRYENVGDQNLPEFRFRDNDYLIGDMLDVGLSSAPAFVDYNQDGLMDIVVGSGGYYTTGSVYDARLFLFENTGTVNEPVFTLKDDDFLSLRQYSNSPQGSYFFTPSFGDMDNDGDLDVIVGEIFGRFFYGENTAGAGNPINVENWVYNYMSISVRSYSAPFLIDLNNDGLLDIIAGGRQGNNDPNDNACSNFYYFQNVGTLENPEFISDPDLLPNTRCLGNALFRTFTVSPYASPNFVRTRDNLLLLAGNDEGKLRLFSNIIGNIYDNFTKESDDYGMIRTGARLHTSAADIDDDGFLELVTGNYRGGLQIFQTDLEAISGSSTRTEFSQEINIFPNPVSSANATIGLTFNKDEGNLYGDILFYDQLGKLITRMKSIPLSENISLNINPGTYIVKVIPELGKTSVTKLLVTP